MVEEEFSEDLPLNPHWFLFQDSVCPYEHKLRALQGSLTFNFYKEPFVGYDQLQTDSGKVKIMHEYSLHVFYYRSTVRMCQFTQASFFRLEYSWIRDIENLFQIPTSSQITRNGFCWLTVVIFYFIPENHFARWGCCFS